MRPPTLFVVCLTLSIMNAERHFVKYQLLRIVPTDGISIHGSHKVLARLNHIIAFNADFVTTCY